MSINIAAPFKHDPELALCCKATMSYEPSTPYTRGLYDQAYDAWKSERSQRAEDEFYPWGAQMLYKWNIHLNEHGGAEMTLLDFICEEV